MDLFLGQGLCQGRRLCTGRTLLERAMEAVLKMELGRSTSKDCTRIFKSGQERYHLSPSRLFAYCACGLRPTQPCVLVLGLQSWACEFMGHKTLNKNRARHKVIRLVMFV